MAKDIALGYIRTFKETIKEDLKEGPQIKTAAALIHITYGFIAYSIAISISLKAHTAFLIGAALISNLISFPIILFLSSFIAFAAFKRGWNPDNFVIPFVTSLSDTIVTISLLSATVVLKTMGL